MLRLRNLPVALATAAAVVLGACSDGSAPSEPIIADTPEPFPGLRSASFEADVDLNNGLVRIASPEAGLDLNLIADYFGLAPDAPQLSILGGDVVDVSVVDGTFAAGAVDVVSLTRLVTFDIQFRNKLSQGALEVSSDLPIPPTGISSPVLFPFENVAIESQGGVIGSGSEIIVELPSAGHVEASDAVFQGPPHNFFNDEGCTATSNDCFLYAPVVEDGSGADAIGGLSTSAAVTLGYDVDATLSTFRSRLILAANVVDAAANVLPVAAFTPAGGACTIGTDIALDGSSSTDSDGFLTNFDWDFGNDGSIDATGANVTFTPPGSAGFVDVALRVTDNRGGQDTVVETFDCQFPPAEATITKELQNGSGTPITSVEVGQAVQYEIVISNASPFTTLTGLTLTDALDADLTGAAVASGPGAITASVLSATVTTLAPSSSITIIVTGTVGALGANDDQLDNTATVDSDQNTSANSASAVSAPMTIPANVFIRWVDPAGNPITSAAVSSGVVFMQICTSEAGLEALDSSISMSLGTFSDAPTNNVPAGGVTGQDLISVPGGASAFTNLGGTGNPATNNGGIHPDCVGTADEFNDAVIPNTPAGTNAGSFGGTAINAPGTGVQGIIEFQVDVGSTTGALDVTLGISNFQVGGVQAAFSISAQTLTVN